MNVSEEYLSLIIDEIKAVEEYSKAILPFIDRAVDVFIPETK